MLKINILSKKREGNNSAYECGKIINIIFKCMTLPKSKLFPLVSGHKEQILKKLKNYFDYFNKVIIQMYAMKIEGFYTQKFEVF